MPPQDDPGTNNVPQQPVAPPPQQPSTPPEPVIPPVLPPQMSATQNIPTQPKRSNLLKIILIAVAILIVVGAVAMFSLYFLLGNDAASNNPTTGSASNSLSPGGVLKANQEDNQRKNHLGQYASTIVEYISNQNGKMPTSADDLNAYIASGNASNLPAKDPSTNKDYQLVDDDPAVGQIQYKPSMVCGDDSDLVEGRIRQYALRTVLSDGSTYCVDV